MDDVGGTERAVAEALWAKVEADLSEAGPHQAYLAHCTDHDMLDEAARRYREAKDALDEKDESLKELLDERLTAIATLAMAKLDVEHEPPPVSPLMRILQLVIIGFSVVSVWMLVRALLM